MSWSSVIEWFKKLFSKVNMPSVPAVEVNPSDISPWFTIAKKYVGEKELTGHNDGPFVADCFKSIGSSLRQDKWCAAFVGRCLKEAGFSYRGVSAMSYQDYGVKCDIKPGAIVVLEHQDGSHHVTFVDHVIDAMTIACLGGNQKNAVCVDVYDLHKHKVVACRWPVK